MSHNHSHEAATQTSAPGGSSQATNLRTAQGPIKEQYKSSPDSALVTLCSSGSLDSASITCAINGPNANAVKDAHKKVAGLHPMAGGPEAEVSGELCSGDMLLEALVACAGVTLKSVATALQVPIRKGEVRAEGDLDFKGVLGVDKNAPAGFTGIRLAFDVELDEGVEVEEAKIEKLGKLTERYCTVLQTIAKKPEIVVRVEAKGEAESGIERSAAWVEKL
ncbi:MAG: hypothetical protein Q9162_002903 [Coniocarpon cinnabarinum]